MRMMKGALFIPECERMAGQLQRHPLTELIREISAGGFLGALRLARERAKAVVYFDAGEIIYAASNLRVYRLSESVRRWNILTEPQLAGVQRETPDLDFGAQLVETGAISREMLNALEARRVSEILCQMLLWTDGDWDFDPRVRLDAEIRVQIETRQLLVESARRLPVEFVAARFTDKSEKLFPEAVASDNLNLSPIEAFVLTRVDTALSIGELSAISGLPEAETLHAVYTLALGGFLRRERWPQALSAEETARARAAVKAAPAKEPSPVAEEQQSAPEKAEPVAPPLTPAEEKRDEQNEIEELFKRIQIVTDHYQLLGIRRSATTADIKRAYYAMAKRFHPDRFRKGAEAAQLARIESAFAKFAQAYDTLKDKTSRATYDSKLLKQEEAARTGRATLSPRQAGANLKQDKPEVSANVSTPVTSAGQVPTSFQAEEKFQQGLSALQQGNSAVAIASLGEAARLAPNESRYRAYFGQALARDQRMRRNAEAEIKAAIALSANNASYRVMLAELYSEIGLLRRAQGEVERALSIDPQNDAARQLLKKFKI
jgi:curved DNA-binding protein CbpA